MWTCTEGLYFKHWCEKSTNPQTYFWKICSQYWEMYKKRQADEFKMHLTPSKLRPQARPFRGLHTSRSGRNADQAATINSLSDHFAWNNGRLSCGQHGPSLSSVVRFYLCCSSRDLRLMLPAVVTDERTWLNAAVVHPSVNMAFPSQIVPLFDSGLDPKFYLAWRTQTTLGGGFKTQQGVIRQKT